MPLPGARGFEGRRDAIARARTIAGAGSSLSVWLAVATLESNTPNVRVARSVKNRDNDERLSSRNVKDGIRETTNQGAPQISINLRMQPRILLDRGKGVVERR